MNIFDNFDEWVNSSAGKKYLENVRKKEEKKKADKESIISNDNYISWLENFTLNGGFSDNNWLYCPEKISEEDRGNVEKLCLLYEIIDEYAKTNFIYPNVDTYSNSYFIMNNDIVYEIGYMFGQEISFFCRRDKAGLLNEKQKNNCIKFGDIKSGKKRPNVLIIERELSALSEYICSLSGIVPIKAIKSQIANTIELMEESEKHKSAIAEIYNQESEDITKAVRSLNKNNR